MAISSETIVEKLYSKFKDLKEKSEEDCKFDRRDIDSAFNNTNKLIYWINVKTEWNRVYRDFERARKDAYRKIYEFYQLEYPLKLSTKEELTLFIESDAGYYPHLNISNITKEVLQYIDSVIDILKARSFEVNNAIKWEQFKNGL